MVQAIHNPYQISMGHNGEILGLGDILPDQSIHVFVRTSFPGRIGMGENEVQEFFTYLASEQKVSASAQNQALSALKEKLELLNRIPEAVIDRAARTLLNLHRCAPSPVSERSLRLAGDYRSINHPKITRYIRI